MKNVVAYSLILLGVSCLFGTPTSNSSTYQNKPDLSGTWVLDWSLSESKGGDKKNRRYDSMTMVITHHEPELGITFKQLKNKQETSQHVDYYTDGRGEKNPVFKSKSLIRSTTKWEGNTLVSRRRTEFYETGDFYFYEVTVSWELSAEGTTLTHSILQSETAQNRYGGKIGMGEYEDRYSKRVYKKTAN